MTAAERKKKRAVLITLTVLVTAIVFYWVGQPLIRFVSDADAFRAWVERYTWWSRVGYIGMVILQVVFAIIPGGVFEVAAGYAFGVVEGTILSMVGTTLGSAMVFLLVKRFGLKYVLLFFTREQLDSVKFMHNRKQLDLIVFIAFVIPGTPKDLLCYVAGLTDMRLGRWLGITTVARIPAVLISAMGGNAIGTESYAAAIGVFCVILAVSGVGLLIYRHISRSSDE